ncbi:MAG: PEP-CTERM sorting domain-containing protein [Planctomycetota bacterium]
MKKTMFVLFVVSCLLSLPAQAAITVTPSIVGELPDSAGENLTFDLMITDPCGLSAMAFEGKIENVSGPDTLTFDETGSMGIGADSGYWLFGNSSEIIASDNLDGTYTFADNTDDGSNLALAADDLVARYVFEYNGIEGDYTFTFDLDETDSFFYFFDLGSFDEQSIPITIDPGTLPGSSNSFTIALIPEPATLMLFGLGGFLLRKRRA